MQTPTMLLSPLKSRVSTALRLCCTSRWLRRRRTSILETCCTDIVRTAPFATHICLTSPQDTFIDRLLAAARANSFTVILTSTPPPSVLPNRADGLPAMYSMDGSLFPPTAQMELKRDVSVHQRLTDSARAGLFERYQFLSAGLFMAMAALVPLLAVLLVGVRALLSLEVSYFAFSKEMGPNAQKKT